MFDIYLAILILAVAVIAAIIYAAVNRKRQQPNLNLRAVPPPRYAYNPGVTIVETNSGFSEGMLAGAMYAQQRPVVEETVVVRDDQSQYQAMQDPSTATPFAGFSGGDSDGGGVTSSLDAPSDSPACDSQNDSPCDSGSGGGDY
jgi:hypothetical protein